MYYVWEYTGTFKADLMVSNGQRKISGHKQEHQDLLWMLSGKSMALCLATFDFVDGGSLRRYDEIS